MTKKTKKRQTKAAKAAVAQSPPTEKKKRQLPPITATMDDFYAYGPTHEYIYTPTRAFWPAASINSRLGDGAATALDRTKSCETMTWMPGEPMIIEGKLMEEDDWVEKKGARTFNLYKKPKDIHGDPDKAGPWRELNERIWADDAHHIELWQACRVQHPEVKINHGIVMGSTDTGIGKDSLLKPLRRAVGVSNFKDISPEQALDPKTNAFLGAVVLRINEVKDLGDKHRVDLYNKSKAWMADPPEVLRVADKYIRAYTIPNLVGVIETTNNKTDGVYLDAEDRRHYVAWSELLKTSFGETKEERDEFWNDFHAWLREGGIEHVAAYLATRDLKDFDPKSPPPQTEAFWTIVNANRTSEEAGFADTLDSLSDICDEERPVALTLPMLAAAASRIDNNLHDFLTDNRNNRAIPHRLEKNGLVPVRNPDAKDGMWIVAGKRRVVYGSKAVDGATRLKAAFKLGGLNRPVYRYEL